MANIQDELIQIQSARYGKDVRKSLYNGLESINTEVNDLNKTVYSSGEDIKNFKNSIIAETSNFKDSITNSVTAFENSTNDGLSNYEKTINTELINSKQDLSSFKETTITAVTALKNAVNQTITNANEVIETITTKADNSINNVNVELSKLDSTNKTLTNTLLSATTLDNTLNKVFNDATELNSNLSTIITKGNSLESTLNTSIPLSENSSNLLEQKIQAGELLAKKLSDINENAEKNDVTSEVKILEEKISSIEKTAGSNLPLTGGTLTGEVKINQNGKTISLKNGAVTIDSARVLYLDPDNNIMINSYDATKNGKALGSTIFKGSLITTDTLQSNSNCLRFSTNEIITIDSDENIIFDKNAVYKEIKFQDNILLTDKTTVPGPNLLSGQTYWNEGLNTNSYTAFTQSIMLEAGVNYVFSANCKVNSVGMDQSASLEIISNDNLETASVHTLNSTSSIITTTLKVKTSQMFSIKVLNNPQNNGSYMSLKWVMVQREQPLTTISYQPNINTTNSKFIALGTNMSNLMITNYKNQNKDKQLGHLATNLMIQNMKNQKDIKTLKEQNKTLANILIRQQLKK